MFKRAAQTIIYGQKPGDLRRVFSEIRKLGFDGVEIFQPLPFLGRTPETVGELSRTFGNPGSLETLLNEYNLTLLGLTTGDLNDRITFCQQLKGRRPLYFYVDYWNNTTEKLLAEGVPLAIHPHFNKGIERFARARELLQKHPLLKIIPDTAHLFLAGESPLAVIEQIKAQIAAIHLKDWTTQFGWSDSTYAHGFVELGRGDLGEDLLSVKSWLHANYEGWVVLELDHSLQSPFDSLRESLSWLDAPKRPPTPSPLKYRNAAPLLGSSPMYSASVATALDVILQDSLKDIETLYSSIAKTSASLFGCSLATIWDVDSRNEALCLRSIWPSDNVIPQVRQLSLWNSISGRAVRAGHPLLVPSINKLHAEGVFKDKVIIQDYGAKTMLSIPVANRFNGNAPELLLNLFPQDSPEGFPVADLYAFTYHLSILLQQFWTAKKLQLHQKFDSINPGQPPSLLKYSTEALKIIQRELDCEAASIFLTDYQGGLELLTSSDPCLRNKQPKVRIKKNTGLLGQAVAERRIIVVTEYPNDASGLEDAIEKTARTGCSVLICPIYKLSKRGAVLGVIRCTGKSGNRPLLRTTFSETDAMLVDAIQGAVSQHLVALADSERRVAGIKCIRHELKVPIGYVSTAAGLAKHDLTPYVPSINVDDWKRVEHRFEDIEAYLDLMRAVADKTLFTEHLEPSSLRLERVDILSQVIGPARHQVRALIAEYAYAFNMSFGRELRLDIRGFDRFPAMWLDKARMQQVCFNILSNAFKYFDREKKFIRIAIIGRPFGAPRILFRDWGLGVTKGLEEAIFEFGFREEKAREVDDGGDGIGLWLVRRFVELHGGTIELTHNVFPTEFTLKFASASLSPPSSVGTTTDYV